MIWMFLLLLVVIAALPFGLEYMRKPMNGAARNDAPGAFVALSDGTTHVQLKGQRRGPLAVCVHGLTTPSFAWDRVAEGLGKMGFRVLTYDLYGRGYSDPAKGAQDEAFFLRQLEEVLDAVEAPHEITLLGYSMGGSIATAFAEKHPDRVDRLILVASAGLGTTQGRFADFVRDTPIIGDWLMLTIGGALCRSGLLRNVPADPYQQETAKMQAAEVSKRGFLKAVLSSQRHMLREDQGAKHVTLEDERVPVLAIWGDEDKIIPLSAMGRMTQANRATRHDIIEGADHAIAYSHPEDICASIAEFLSENASR